MQKARMSRFISFAALLLLCFGASAKAEGVTTFIPITSNSPEVKDAGLKGYVNVFVTLSRDASGKPISGRVRFNLYLSTKNKIEARDFVLREGTGNDDLPIRFGPKSIGTIDSRNNYEILFALENPDPDLLQRILTHPKAFYVEMSFLQATIAPMRGRINGFSLVSTESAPIIHLSDTHLLTAAERQTKDVFMTVSNFDTSNFSPSDNENGVQVNDRPVSYSASIITAVGDNPLNAGVVVMHVTPDLIAKDGILSVRIRNNKGLLSEPIKIVVASAEKLNSTALTTVDAARFGDVVAPSSIAAAFGAALGARPVSATQLPLPISLDGVSVYVNGVSAVLFFVSEKQINYAIPPGTPMGQSTVVATAKNGTVSRGVVNVEGTIPAIFSGKSDGAGAPAGLASNDGSNFDVLLSTPEGDPVPVSAGSYIALFGVGLRHAFTPMKVLIGDVEVDPLYFGAQGSFEGLDQVNLQIPQTLAGRDEVDLVVSVDGKQSNPVKLRIK